MKKFLLVDDHVAIRSGIKVLLLDMYDSCLIYEAYNEQTILWKLKESDYDLIIMDIQLPETDTFALVEHISSDHPSAKVLMFSMGAENIYAKRVLKAGAKGFLSKDSGIDEIKKAITQVLDNRNYISEALADSLITESYSGNPSNPFSKLSSREFEILSLMLEGQTLSEISASLNIKASTAGTYKMRIFEKLGAKNILDLKELATVYKL